MLQLPDEYRELTMSQFTSILENIVEAGPDPDLFEKYLGFLPK